MFQDESTAAARHAQGAIISAESPLFVAMSLNTCNKVASQYPRYPRETQTDSLRRFSSASVLLATTQVATLHCGVAAVVEMRGAKPQHNPSVFVIRPPVQNRSTPQATAAGATTGPVASQQHVLLNAVQYGAVDKKYGNKKSTLVKKKTGSFA